MKKLLMGNEAIGIAALNAGVSLVSGYPGTPSTEILETVAKQKNKDVYVEWSTNEKAALEVAAGASYAGCRTMVTMKQVGLNVASDPLMSLAYVGIKGGMVVVVADDPGPISSQTEQDTRKFAEFSKLPIFDPSSPEEAYQMVFDAFELSERISSPVLLRPTTRICHSCAAVEIGKKQERALPEGFIKDPKWVIFPRLSYANHKKIEIRNRELSETLSEYSLNKIEGGEGRKGIACGGISYSYIKEAISGEDLPLLKIATPHPFPEKLSVEFLKNLDEVLVFEELDPVIERELIYLCGKYHLHTKIRGKLSGDTEIAGENSAKSAKDAMNRYLGRAFSQETKEVLPELPIRPPVLCAGCPHRSSFYAVKQAMKGKKAVFSGDIGCYTLGNAMPLDMVDTCLCMGAGITIAQGLHRAESDTVNIAFIGDSTFFASGMTGVANAVYNETDLVIIVLDNATTAMTGQQPHPGTGRTMMGSISEKISIEGVLRALGVKSVKRVNPFDFHRAVSTVKEAATGGVRAIIFESPCIALLSSHYVCSIEKNACIGCKKCIKELGCPAISFENGKALIESSLCRGCGLCKFVCPAGAIFSGGEKR